MRANPPGRRTGVVAGLNSESRDAAMRYARHFASMRPETLQATKRALNQWLHLFRSTVYEPALMMEFMTFPKDFAARFRPAPVDAGEAS